MIYAFLVSDRVGSVKNNSPENIKPLEEVKKGGISSFFKKEQTAPLSPAPAVPLKEVLKGASPVKPDGNVAVAAKRALEDSDEVVEFPAVKREKKFK